MEQNTIYKKIGLLRNKIDEIKKDSKNPFFKSSYADINSIERLVEPIEHEVGLTHTISSSVTDNGKQHLTLTVADIETGETLSSTLEIIINKQDMQQLIAGHTYGRRGLLVSFYSLEADDDDGNFASGKTGKPKPQAIKHTVDEVKSLAKLKNVDEAKICEAYKVLTIDQMDQATLNKVFNQLKAK